MAYIVSAEDCQYRFERRPGNPGSSSGSKKPGPMVSSSKDGSASGSKKPARKPGVTCHQCRQKITTSSALCTKMKTVNKRCPMKYCHKCLQYRYGENIEEVVEGWECPKCRRICNCSCCMRNQGLDPTGRLKLSEINITTEHMLTMDVSPSRVKRPRKPKSRALPLAILPAAEQEHAPPISLTPEAQQEQEQEQTQAQAMALIPETEQETAPYPNNEYGFPNLDVNPWDEVHDRDDDIFDCCDDIANLGDL